MQDSSDLTNNGETLEIPYDGDQTPRLIWKLHDDRMTAPFKVSNDVWGSLLIEVEETISLPYTLKLENEAGETQRHFTVVVS